MLVDPPRAPSPGVSYLDLVFACVGCLSTLFRNPAGLTGNIRCPFRLHRLSAGISERGEDRCLCQTRRFKTGE
jgi:hypothetical protein